MSAPDHPGVKLVSSDVKLDSVATAPKHVRARWIIRVD